MQMKTYISRALSLGNNLVYVVGQFLFPPLSGKCYSCDLNYIERICLFPKKKQIYAHLMH